MQKIILTTALVILMALMGCSDPAQAPEEPTPTATTTPTQIQPPSQAPSPTAVALTMPAKPSATEYTPAATASPTTQPEGQTPAGAIIPLSLDDPESVASELSDQELACLAQIADIGELLQIFSDPSIATTEEQAELIGCLNDETVARIFLAGFVPDSGPLSLDTSTCIRAAFTEIDPRAVMTAGAEGDPAAAMAGTMTAFIVTLTCLNQEEWETTAPQVGMDLDEREGMLCVLEELGGSAEMVAAMIAANEGDAAALSAAAMKCGLDMGPAPGQTPVRPEPTSQPTTTLVITVAAIPEGIPEYDRSNWKHWTDEDSDCQDARQEVLIEESLMEVTFKTDRKCEVASGWWYGAYTGEFTGVPGDLDIDHMVPLKNAHNSGGWAWDTAKKEKYANHLDDHDHLIAVTAGANRSKGAKGPEEWGPPDLDYWCEYSWDWTEIKARWGLTMTQIEAEIVMDMLHTCDDPPELEMKRLYRMETKVGEHKPTPEPEGPVYDSCEEANAAGEERVQGSQGNGRGFPKAMVPSARDGDDDGIVCER